MAEQGIDFAWSKPTPSQVKAAGASWIAGYFSNDTSKNLTRSLVSGYLAAGIGVVTVWESTAGRATAGKAAGVADAKAADAQRAACGLGADHVIYFAVDEDTSWASVQAYFDGVLSVLGAGRTGAYGSYAVVEGAYGHGIHYLWQTVAWSGGKWSGHASIRQPGGTLLGGSADIDQAEVADFGQSPRPEVDVALTTADVALLLNTKLGKSSMTVGQALQSGIVQGVWDHTEVNVANQQDTRMGTFLRYGDFMRNQQTSALQATITGLQAAVTALAAKVGSGVDTAAVVSAVQQAIADAVVHVEIGTASTPSEAPHASA
jgi:hypothetical protein